MNKKLYKFNPKDQDLFKDVIFLVEANDNEVHSFWRDHFHEPRKDYIIVKWEQEFCGQLIQIGELDNRPVNIAISYAKLNDKRVMFYYACSQVVDHAMVENWLKHFTLETIRWDNNTRWAHCNSSNFHHCIEIVTNIS